MRKQVCNFTLEWTPGTRLQYHPRSAFWVAAALIEAINGGDYRDFLRTRVIEPLGVARELFVGVPDAEHHRIASIFEPDAKGTQQLLQQENTPEARRAGIDGTVMIQALVGRDGHVKDIRIVNSVPMLDRAAEVAAKEGIDLRRANVRTLSVAGEPGGSIPATRAKRNTNCTARITWSITALTCLKIALTSMTVRLGKARERRTVNSASPEGRWNPVM